MSMIPSQEAIDASGTEVIVHNAIWAGKDVFEYGDETVTVSTVDVNNGTVTIPDTYKLVTQTTSSSTYEIPLSWRQLYLSKRQNLEYFNTWQIPNVTSLVNNVPDTAPTASAAIATSWGTASLATRALIGVVEPGTTSIPAGVKQDVQIVVSMSADFVSRMSTIQAALTGNIIFISSSAGDFTGSVDSYNTLGGSYLTMSFVAATSRSLEITSGDVRILSLVGLSSSINGIYMNRTVFSPSSVPVDVGTHSGTIRDVRAWVEFVHDVSPSRSLSGELTGTYGTGLKAVNIALRSPNTNFYSAHPMWNSPAGINLPLIVKSGLQERYYGVPELLKNSYLLWDGHECYPGPTSSVADAGNYFYEFDNDLHMRTIFWDGSPVRNPRDVTAMFPSATLTSSGDTGSNQQLLPGYNSPTSGAIAQGLSYTLSLTGTGVPWILDSRILTGCLPQSGSVLPWNVSGSSMAPAEWLTGSSLPSVGMSFGPERIRPMYPLLDNLTVLLATAPDSTYYAENTYKLPANHGPVRGFRPGLRGTEVTGTWNFMFGNAYDSGSYNGVGNTITAHSASGIWVRQVNLEFIVDAGVGPFEFTPSRSRKWKKPTLVPGPDGFQNQSVVIGSSAWDFGPQLVQRTQDPDYGRTVGITTDKSSTTFAVMTFLSGNLSSSLAARGESGMWFLTGNGFGTPYIPDTSMSLGDVAPDQIDASASMEMYRQTMGIVPTIPNANSMADYLSREGYSQTTEQRWTETLASVTSSNP